jgi:hypothetical protein
MNDLSLDKSLLKIANMPDTEGATTNEETTRRKGAATVEKIQECVVSSKPPVPFLQVGVSLLLCRHVVVVDRNPPSGCLLISVPSATWKGKNLLVVECEMKL